jgi:probable HAF family extracellular repeat protein
MRIPDLLGTFIAGALTFVASPALGVSYDLIDLSTALGMGAVVSDINNSGWLAGTSGGHAFLYDGTTMHDLGTLGGTSSEGSAINNNGWVTGSSVNGDGDEHAFLYDGTTMHDLGAFASGSSSRGTDINDSGWVTGYGNFVGDTGIPDVTGGTHAFLYDGTTMHDLGDLGWPLSYGYGINNSGWVAGYSWINEGRFHAFLYVGTTMHDLGTLEGEAKDDSTARAVNDNGWITGTSASGEPPPSYAFLYDGTMNDLGTLSGLINSGGRDINSSGWVVGTGFNSTLPLNFTAFLYDGTSLLDLCVVTDCTNNGWDGLSEAIAINDRGDIIGTGVINGETRPFLALAAPLPPAVWLFGTGLLGLVGIAGRKNAA